MLKRPVSRVCVAFDGIRAGTVRQARLSLLWFALSLIRILVSFLSCISMCMQAASDPWTRSFKVADVSFLCTCMKCNVHMFLKCFYPEAFSQARLKAFVCILCPPRTLETWSLADQKEKDIFEFHYFVKFGFGISELLWNFQDTHSWNKLVVSNNQFSCCVLNFIIDF